MGRYDIMCMIPRKLFQKMLNFVWWFYFQTFKIIMVNYHTRFESKFCMYPCSAGGKRVLLIPQYHEYFVGLICSNFENSAQFLRLTTRRKKTFAYITVNIWKSYTWTVVKETNMEAILAVMNATLVVVKIRPEKNSGSYGIWIHDLYDTARRFTGINSIQIP